MVAYDGIFFAIIGFIYGRLATIMCAKMRCCNAGEGDDDEKAVYVDSVGGGRWRRKRE